MIDSSEQFINKNDLIETNRKYAEQRRQELQGRETELVRLRLECEQIRRELNLIDAWLETASMSGGNEEGSAQPDCCDENDAAVPALTANLMDVSEIRGDRLRDEVVKVLEEAYPQDLYYREIHSRLITKGFQVGGKNPGLNLIAHLAKEPRVKRGEKRGIYGLDDTNRCKPV